MEMSQFDDGTSAADDGAATQRRPSSARRQAVSASSLSDADAAGACSASLPRSQRRR